jgi:hypothetical protein
MRIPIKVLFKTLQNMLILRKAVLLSIKKQSRAISSKKEIKRIARFGTEIKYAQVAPVS